MRNLDVMIEVPKTRQYLTFAKKSSKGRLHEFGLRYRINKGLWLTSKQSRRQIMDSQVNQATYAEERVVQRWVVVLVRLWQENVRLLRLL